MHVTHLNSTWDVTVFNCAYKTPLLERKNWQRLETHTLSCPFTPFTECGHALESIASSWNCYGSNLPPSPITYSPIISNSLIWILSSSGWRTRNSLSKLTEAISALHFQWHSHLDFYCCTDVQLSAFIASVCCTLTCM